MSCLLNTYFVQASGVTNQFFNSKREKSSLIKISHKMETQSLAVMKC